MTGSAARTIASFLISLTLTVFFSATFATAQSHTGSVYGTVAAGGSGMPGVTVKLTPKGGGAPWVSVTGSDGTFRFTSLDPGQYDVAVSGTSIAPVTVPVRVRAGGGTTLEIDTQVSISEPIHVAGDVPLLGSHSYSTGTAITQQQVDELPLTRDPWAVLQSTPGVLTDRINVGGNEAGNNWTSLTPGTGGGGNTFLVDGINVTDVGALGNSPAYFDFDSFEELQITTGGSDATIATGGVVTNVITKRGTNEWRGSGRYDYTDFGDGVAQPLNNSGVNANDYGVDIGGPIIKDRLWIWGAYGTQRVDLTESAAGTLFDGSASRGTGNVKLNAQLTPQNSATFAYFNSRRESLGPSSLDRSLDATWNTNGSANAFKIEDQHIFSSNFYLTGLYSVVNGGFDLDPAGTTTLDPVLSRNDVWLNSYLQHHADRPQQEFKLDASNFFNTGSLSHELKFGAGYRGAEQADDFDWGPRIGLDTSSGFRIAYPGTQHVDNTVKYTSAYAQDTLTIGNLTANIGIRYDQQKGAMEEHALDANPLAPSVVRRVTTPAQDTIDWSTISPRLGFTYALGEERKTLLRASYARFAEQLGTGTAGFENPIQGGTSVRGAVVYDGSTILGSFGPPTFTRDFLNFNQVAPDLAPPLDDELLMGIEHALLPEFVVGLNLTYRKVTDALTTDELVFTGQTTRPATASDYVRQATISGNTPEGDRFTVDAFTLRSGLSIPSGGGQFLRNSEATSAAPGFELNFNRRLKNRWMLRGNITWSDWSWTNADATYPGVEQPRREDGGAAVLQSPSADKANVYINSNWSYNVSGLYQLAPDRPWGFNVALSAHGRQGYTAPYFVTFTTADGSSRSIGVEAVDTRRMPSIHLVDVAVRKNVDVMGHQILLNLDIFNAADASTILQHRLNLGAVGAGTPLESLGPRTYRVGAQFRF